MYAGSAEAKVAVHEKEQIAATRSNVDGSGHVEKLDIPPHAPKLASHRQPSANMPELGAGGKQWDTGRFSSMVGWVNMSTACPERYIRAEIWCGLMRKFSNGEMKFQAAVDSYRAAIKRLGINPGLDDDSELIDKRGIEKDREIMEILRRAWE